MFTETPALNTLGSWGLDHFFSWGLNAGVFTSAATAVAADLCLGPLSEGAAFVSQVSSNTSSFLVEWSDNTHELVTPAAWCVCRTCDVSQIVRVEKLRLICREILVMLFPTC